MGFEIDELLSEKERAYKRGHKGAARAIGRAIQLIQRLDDERRNTSPATLQETARVFASAANYYEGLVRTIVQYLGPEAFHKSESTGEIDFGRLDFDRVPHVAAIWSSQRIAFKDDRARFAKLLRKAMPLLRSHGETDIADEIENELLSFDADRIGDGTWDKSAARR